MTRALRGSWLRALTAGGAVLLCSGPAAADPPVVWSEPCIDMPLVCRTAPLAYDKTIAQPIEWTFDTGWIPPSSDLQVRLSGGLYANTRVKMSGALVTLWPDALTLRAPGDRESGELSYHYGVELVIEGKIDVSFGGQTIDWSGVIPPTIDKGVEAAAVFDAWGWPPGVTASAVSPNIPVAKVDLLDLVAPNVPGFGAGLELQISVDLDATYINDRMVVTRPTGERVTGGDLIHGNDVTEETYHGATRLEFDVHPEGRVHYGGVLHLIPSLYAQLPGKKWTLPVLNAPVPIPMTQQDWVFDPQRVVVLLPDLRTDPVLVDFGVVPVGEPRELAVSVANAGEAPVELLASVLAGTGAEPPFWSDGANRWLDPGAVAAVPLWFIAPGPGPFEATLEVVSNDPDAPVRTILLRGVGEGDVLLGDGSTGTGGCACEVAGAGSGPPGRGGWAPPLLAALGLLFGRRRAGGRA